MSELALPAASLQGALQAFKGGADAVYLGLQHYSARKAAHNFTLSEVALLKEYARNHHKRIYVAINTLLEDDELSSLVGTLRELERLSIDGIIVQDLGLAHLIQSHFPSIELHSSTQLAVHTVDGVKQLQQLGFKRVVLARELTLKEIEHIRCACPDIELKVFIHGAMCYGFSGLCMASHLLSGRSANRGECSQICRTYFSDGDKESFPFSMKDLDVEQSVRHLKDIGIDSLKVEGRMKSPSYAYYAARYYRLLLENKEHTNEFRLMKEHLHAQFSRLSHKGWTFDYGKEKPLENRHTPSLITTDYPSHRGIYLGEVSSEGEITLKASLALRDGVMVLPRKESAIKQPAKWALQDFTQSNNKRVHRAYKGDKVRISLPSELSHTHYPLDLYKISNHDGTLPLIREYPKRGYAYPLNLDVSIASGSCTIETHSLPQWMGTSLRKRYPLDVQQARKEQNSYANIFNAFSIYGESSFTLGSLTVHNTTTWDENALFLPLSQLKEIKQQWYTSIETLYNESLHSTLSQSDGVKRESVCLPQRNMLHDLKAPHIPWVFLQGENTQLPYIDGYYYLPLPPVSFDEKKMFSDLDKIVERYPHKIRVGLNNVSHIQWAQKNPHIEVFGDIYLYMANRESASLLSEQLPQLIGLYPWVEKEDISTDSWPIQATPVGPDVPLPLFISRACYRYDVLGLGCEMCPRKGEYEIHQHNISYRIDVVHCITIVTRTH